MVPMFALTATFLWRGVWRMLASGSGASASPGNRDVLIPIMDQMKSYCASALAILYRSSYNKAYEFDQLL